MKYHTRNGRFFLTAFLCGSFLIAGCATGTGTTTGSSAPSTSSSSGDIAQSDQGWSTATREYLDLWLHGFAILTSDTARVPYFQRGYRQRMLDLKRQRNVLTTLDANRDKLSARFTTNPGLVNAQFVAMYFPSLEEISKATSFFLQAEGDPRRASDPTVQSEIALLAANFPTPADRDWLRLYVQGLQDESNKFYHAYWTTEQQNRAAARAAFESLWRSTYYQKFRRFLNNTQQAAGELILSLPLDGEGRTISDGKRANAVAVAFPQTAATSSEALYVFAHEIVGKVAETAISDNVTPAQRRTGVMSSYTANAAVRGGALLLQRIAPELVAGYMRYYLASAGSTSSATDPTAAFNAAFPLPDTIRESLSRQIELVLGGI
jgi:hypothetical protein